MIFRGAFALMLLLLPLLMSAAEKPSSVAGELLAVEVRSIFKAKCADCHGSQLERPKAKFGYVLDLARVAANPEFVEPGNATGSEIYQLVLHDEMPPTRSKHSPLSAREKQAVQEWIEAGAPAPAAPLPAAAVVTPEVPPAGFTRVLRWIGQWHMVSTHFPIAFLLGAALAELLVFLGATHFRSTVRFLMFTGAIGAVMTAALGWSHAWFVHFVGEMAMVLDWHRWVGVGAAGWGLVCLFLLVRSEKQSEDGELRGFFRVALILGALLMIVTGFLGGVLVYGWEHYAW